MHEELTVLQKQALPTQHVGIIPVQRYFPCMTHSHVRNPSIRKATMDKKIPETAMLPWTQTKILREIPWMIWCSVFYLLQMCIATICSLIFLRFRKSANRRSTIFFIFYLEADTMNRIRQQIPLTQHLSLIPSPLLQMMQTLWQEKADRPISTLLFRTGNYLLWYPGNCAYCRRPGNFF